MKTVLCFGDSNTHGTMPMAAITDRRRHARADRWPNVMAAALGEGYEVISEGNPGRTTVHRDPVVGDHRSGLDVLPSMLESHEPVDIVVLKLGTNDMQHRFCSLPIDIARAVDKLVATVLQSDNGPDFSAPRVLLVAPPPVLEAGGLAEIFTGAAEKSKGLAPLYRAIAQKRGVAFFEAGSVMEVSPIDGIHYEAEAHHALGAAIADAVRAMR